MRKITAGMVSGMLAFAPVAAQANSAGGQFQLTSSSVISQVVAASYTFSMAANPCATGMQGCVLPIKAAPAPAPQPVAQPTAPQPPVAYTFIPPAIAVAVMADAEPFVPPVAVSNIGLENTLRADGLFVT